MKKLLLLLVAVLPAAVLAQPKTTPTLAWPYTTSGPPIGSCFVNQIDLDTSTGNIYSCKVVAPSQTGTWGIVGIQTVGNVPLVGPGGYSAIALAAAALGQGQALGIIQNNYPGTECAVQAGNLVWLDIRGQAAPCNANNSISINNDNGTVHSLFRVDQNISGITSVPAAIYGNTYITGAFGGPGSLSDAIAATTFTTGLTYGTQGKMRGTEFAVGIFGVGGTVTVAEGGASYVAGLSTSTTVIGTARGWDFVGCNSQTYGVAPINCVGADFESQQGKGSSTNFTARFFAPVLFKFDGINFSQGGMYMEDASNVAHQAILVDGSSNLNINAVGTNLQFRDSGFTTRAGLAGSVFTIPTACSISQTRPAESPVPLCASTLQKNETATADANVLTYTPPAAAGEYNLCATISVSAATAGVISWTASWTDSNGNAQANIAMPLFQLGTAAPNTTFTTSAAGDYFGCSTVDVNNAAASIIIKWVGGGTTTAKMSATIQRNI